MQTIKKRFQISKEKCFLLLASIIFTFSNVQAQDQNIEELILKKDAEFWKGYNSCDISTMNNFLAEDIEFYHDKGGIELGSKKLNEGLKKGLCQTGKNHLRREAISESIEVFPLMDNNKLYGAILSGEHLFYTQEEGSERLDGQAKFNHLWLLKDGEWKMHRVLSYDHRAPEYKSENKNIELSKDQLEKFTGSYKMPSNDIITVEALDGSLKLLAMGKEFIVYPKSETRFFSKDRDLSFHFSKDDPRKLQIYEGDNQVAEATYSE